MKQIFFIIAIAMMGFIAKTNAQTIKQANIIPITNSLAIVSKLSPITFTYEKGWLQQLNLKESHSGFNMEEIAKFNPKLIINQQLNYNAGKNNTKTAIVQKLDYEALIPLLVGSIKEQQQQIETLKAELNLLKNKSAK